MLCDTLWSQLKEKWWSFMLEVPESRTWSFVQCVAMHLHLFTCLPLPYEQRRGAIESPTTPYIGDHLARCITFTNHITSFICHKHLFSFLKHWSGYANLWWYRISSIWNSLTAYTQSPERPLASNFSVKQTLRVQYCPLIILAFYKGSGRFGYHPIYRSWESSPLCH